MKVLEKKEMKQVKGGITALLLGAGIYYGLEYLCGEGGPFYRPPGSGEWLGSEDEEIDDFGKVTYNNDTMSAGPTVG